MSLMQQMRAYLETYYPQLFESADDTDAYYFEHRCSFEEFPSLVAVTVDKKMQILTLQVMIGQFFEDYESDHEVFAKINDLNKEFKFASFSEINGTLNLEHHLLIQSQQEELPPILEYLLLLTAAANELTGAADQFDFILEDFSS